MDCLGLVVAQGAVGLLVKAHREAGHNRRRRIRRRKRRGGRVKALGLLLHRSFVLHQQ